MASKLKGNVASPRKKIFTGALPKDTTNSTCIKHSGKYGEIRDSDIAGCDIWSDNSPSDILNFFKILIFVLILVSFLYGLGFFLLTICFPSLWNDPFTFQVDFVEAEAKASLSVNNNSCLNVPSCAPALESDGLSLDLNFTLSLSHRHPIVFDSLQTVLSYGNDNSVLASNTVDGLYRRSPGPMQVGFAGVQVFSSEEDKFGLELTLALAGHYWSLVENKLNHKYHFRIACEGVKIALHSSSTRNFIAGRMLGGPLPCK